MKDKLRLLIAENNEDYVWLLVQFLSKFPKFEVIGVAYDGRQAVEMVLQTKPDVLLLDIVMPELDGFEVLKRIRCHGAWVKVFVMSALGLPQFTDAAKALGVEGYYIKPFDFHLMVKEIGKLAESDGAAQRDCIETG